jgi:hypothetical protein
VLIRVELSECTDHSRRDETVEGYRGDGGIGIDSKDILVEGRVDTDYVLDLMVYLEFERTHRRSEVDLHTASAKTYEANPSTDLVQEVHNQ